MKDHVKKPAILWADDDPDDLMIMRDVLHHVENHHHIIEVDNGQKVLDYLNAAQSSDDYPCLIVLDMNMPVLGGRETLATIKKHPQFSTIPVVVFTTSNSELDRMFCKRYGAEMFSKPPSFTSFKDVVSRLLNYCSVSAKQQNDAQSNRA